MRRWLALVAWAACTDVGPVECTDSHTCDLKAGGQCAAAPSGVRFCRYPDSSCGGYRWSQYAGDGLAGQCASVVGGGVGAIDAPLAGGADAPRATADAPPGAADVLDTTPPETTIDGKPSAISGPDVTFLFSSNETGSTFECNVDG